MSDALDFVFLQCLVATAGITILLFRRQTAYLGITCLFAFQVFSSSLSGFFFGRLFGLREQWITAYHESVLTYSGWACLAAVAAMWLAWWPSKRERRNFRDVHEANKESFLWVTKEFVFFALCLGAVCTALLPMLSTVPTVGTGMTLLASWLKLGLIIAVVLFKIRGDIRPLMIAIIIYFPAAMIYALRSGHTPFSVDALISIALVASCLNRVTLMSFVKLFGWMIPCVYLMFGWMASRSVIRSGELEQFSMSERAARFADVFVDNVMGLKVTAYDVQYLLFDRIDMTDLLAQQVGFQSSPTGEDEYQYGGTIMDGLYSVIPRALWPDKPIVAGYADFVSQFTGIVRESGDPTSIGIPVQFELYANGGPTLVVVGVFMLFYLCARFERFVASSARSLTVLMPSIMVLMCFGSGIERITIVAATGAAGGIASFVVAKIIEMFFPQLLPQFRIAKIRRQLRGPLPATT
jgi:hypothetical protein